jgi:hypothetical protein
LDGANELVALSGGALLLGLFLSAIHTGLLWVLDGWPIFEGSQKGARKWLDEQLRRGTERDHRRLTQDGDARRLRERFPAEGGRLPTRLGNARRAVETHPYTSHHLDGVQALARIRLLLSDAERQQIADAEGDVAFMVNGLVLVGPVAGLLTAVVIGAQHTFAWTLLLIALIVGVSVLAAYVLYQLAIRVTVDRWGPLVRAAFDMHLLDLYDRLAVRRPESPAEDLQIGEAVNAQLLHGTPLDADVRSGDRRPS